MTQDETFQAAHDAVERMVDAGSAPVDILAALLGNAALVAAEMGTTRREFVDVLAREAWANEVAFRAKRGRRA